MTYVDLNLCRAGVVRHPEDWECSGYQRIQHPPQRYRIIDRERAAERLGYRNVDDLSTGRAERVNEALSEPSRRDEKWSESLAVGSEGFAASVAARLEIRARHRGLTEHTDGSVLREPVFAYSAHSPVKTVALSADNTRLWKLST